MVRNKFQPDWASPPGETLSDILRDKAISHADFARSFGETKTGLDALLRGHVELTAQHAQKLENLFGVSSAFWLNRESQYRQDIQRIKAQEEESMSSQWLSELPLKDMVNFGWLKSTGAKPTLAECLSFFGVASVAEWHTDSHHKLGLASFRTSAAFDQKPLAVAAWLRKGEIDGMAQSCKAWNSEKFYASLIQIRSLTRKKMPSEFLPELSRICGDAGVALVVARAPNGCRASGAARFLTPSRALIILSFRHLTDDHFWFSFFHEAGHILLHKKDKVFVDGLETENTEEEQEANTFSEHVLVPEQHLERMRTLPLNSREILRFAKEIGISAGVVIGQMQNSGRVRHDRLNAYKQRYVWEDIDAAF
jgi:HTH-type transcriptional regulator/antitoxin HigA